MSQWGQNQANRPQVGYGSSNRWDAPSRPAQQWTPGGQWAPPHAQQGWAPPRGPQTWAPNNTSWQATQYKRPSAGYGYQQPIPGGRQPKRRGGSQILTLLLFAIGGVIVVLIALSLLGPADDPVITPPGEYENESYQVPNVDQNPPEIPVPATYAEATQWLTDNPVYNASIAVPVRCEAHPIDLNAASRAGLQAHFNELTGCLMRVFGPALEDAGYFAVRPSVTIYTSPVNTKCGTMPMQNAAYCSADQQVYYAADLPTIVPQELRHVDYAVESVIAHEFAHAIQGRTGILISEAAWEQRSDDATADNLSRRLEVQADCWAGQFIQAVGESVGIDQDEAHALSNLFYSIGDDVLTGDPNYVGNHGHGRSRQTWFLEGHETTLMGACNTFVVGDDEVR